jgi:hypothetical protein
MGKAVFNYYRMWDFHQVYHFLSSFHIVQFFPLKLLFLQSVVEIHNAQRHNRDVEYYEFLEEIKNSLRIHMSTLMLLILFVGSIFSIVKVT